MTHFNDVGKLMHLPLKDIQPGEPTTAPEFVITAAAEVLMQTGGRNWVPLVVKQTGQYEYQVISHTFVYAVAEQAGLERVWAIVTEDKPQTIELVKILAGETLPKINLTMASRDAIKAGLQYLIEKPGSAVKAVNLLVATDKIATADRSQWKNFEPITKLKCGITKAKLPALAEIFYLAPTVTKALPPAPQAISIKQASRDEIHTRLQYLKDNKIGGFDTVDADQAADTIFTSSKGKWKSLNAIANLDCGIEKAQIKTLKTVFSL